MPFDAVIWDRDDDPHGNVHHCTKSGLTKEEIEAVFLNGTDADVSPSSGRPVVFGDTETGKRLMLVYELVNKYTIYPIVAYEIL